MVQRISPWFASMVVLLALAGLLLVACGPEAARARNGGLGGSSRPTAPPTIVSEPALVVQPTMNIPYATSGPLPTLRPGPSTPSPGNPVTMPDPTRIATPTR